MGNEQLTFGWGSQEPEVPTGPLPAMRPLAERLGKLATRGVYLGTSSWKYPGWLNKVYDPRRYQWRGKFVEKRFNRDCLAEYTSIFPTVCGDFVFYQFPSERTWTETFAQIPAGHRFSLKVPEDVTVEHWPDLPRYGKRAGKDNGHFMDASLVNDQLLSRLDAYRDRLGALIFQFGTIRREPMTEPGVFAEHLDRMLSRLPLDRYAFAVEVRNPAFVTEGGPYLDVLREHGVAHCLNSWTLMPPITEQMRIPGVFTARHVVARLLLRPGRTYQQAVERFAPYERVGDPYPDGRAALRELIERLASDDKSLYVFVNNRFEGNAIETIEASLPPL